MSSGGEGLGRRCHNAWGRLLSTGLRPGCAMLSVSDNSGESHWKFLCPDESFLCPFSWWEKTSSGSQAQESGYLSQLLWRTLEWNTKIRNMVVLKEPVMSPGLICPKTHSFTYLYFKEILWTILSIPNLPYWFQTLTWRCSFSYFLSFFVLFSNYTSLWPNSVFLHFRNLQGLFVNRTE